MSLQDGLDLSDAVRVTQDLQQPYAIEWPKLYKKRVPNASCSQSLQETFNWPAKAKANLEKLSEQVGPGVKPALLYGKRQSISSNFSGICSQSRGSQILENHSFGPGCHFNHVTGLVDFGLVPLRRATPISCVVL